MSSPKSVLSPKSSLTTGAAYSNQTNTNTTSPSHSPATLVRRTSASSTGSASPTSQIKASLKKLTVSSEETPYRSTTAGSSSPVSRPRASSGLNSPSALRASSSTAGSTSTVSSASTIRRTSTSNMSTTPVRSTVTKAPVQSPTAGGIKRPASGNGLSTLSSIGPSAMSAAAANPYSSALSASPIASAAPSSPIASASPNARRFKPTGSPVASVAPASPIHSISQSGAAAASAKRYEAGATSVGATYAASTSSSAAYRAAHPGAHAPVNTHSHPPQGHVSDHVVAGPNGPTIFSPVYSRTASQEQLRLEEEKAAAANKAKGTSASHAATLQRQQEEEERYRQAVAAQQYAAQQAQAAAEAARAAAIAAQQQQHTVSYTPPQVEEDEFDPFLFIKNLPPLSSAMRNRRSPLPKKSPTAPRITLALDLDETLVHCSVQPIDKAELTFKVAFNGQDYEVYARTRPHMKEFLETVSQWFEVVIFTASQKVYADKLLNILDPHGQYIKYRIFRDSCVCVDGNYLKDLHILGRELNTVAIVDNSVQAFGFQLDHGIPIESWFDDESDRELLNLIPFLRQLKDAKDVRPLIRETFRLSDFVASL